MIRNYLGTLIPFSAVLVLNLHNPQIILLYFMSIQFIAVQESIFIYQESYSGVLWFSLAISKMINHVVFG